MARRGQPRGRHAPPLRLCCCGARRGAARCGSRRSPAAPAAAAPAAASRRRRRRRARRRDRGGVPAHLLRTGGLPARPRQLAPPARGRRVRARLARPRAPAVRVVHGGPPRAAAAVPGPEQPGLRVAPGSRAVGRDHHRGVRARDGQRGGARAAGQLRVGAGGARGRARVRPGLAHARAAGPRRVGQVQRQALPAHAQSDRGRQR